MRKNMEILEGMLETKLHSKKKTRYEQTSQNIPCFPGHNSDKQNIHYCGTPILILKEAPLVPYCRLTQSSK